MRQLPQGSIDTCSPTDLGEVLAVINDAANAYANVIPPDCYHEPYMSRRQLDREVDSGVIFQVLRVGGTISGVMGVQEVLDVTLIRHAYVRTAARRQGVGARLLNHLVSNTERPILIGTWKAATWAIDFYRKHGFEPVPEATVPMLLRRYWSIPERQIETSVVLAQPARRYGEK